MTNTDTQRPDEQVEAIRKAWHVGGHDLGVILKGTAWGDIRDVIAAYDKQRARAERAEADRDDIAASYSRVLMYITDGALSMPSTEPQMAIAMADDLDTKRWNEEMSEYEARAERAEQREARLREALASVEQLNNRLRQILVNHGYDIVKLEKITDACAADEGDTHD